jgi:hypothetical protein
VDGTAAHDRSAGALGTEAWKGLDALILGERRDREKLPRRDGAVASTTVDANLEHAGAPFYGSILLY